METGGSLPHSHQPTTYHYHEQDQSSSCPPKLFIYDPVEYYAPSTPESSKWSLSLTFRHQNPVCTSPPPYESCTHLA